MLSATLAGNENVSFNTSSDDDGAVNAGTLSGGDSGVFVSVDTWVLEDANLS